MKSFVSNLIKDGEQESKFSYNLNKEYPLNSL